MELLTNELTSALSFVGKAVSSRPTHPVLAGVLFEASEGKLHLSGFDLSIGAKVTIAAEVTEPESIVVPYKLLMDLVSRMDVETLHFTSESDREINLKAGTGSYRLSCFAPSEFPALFEVNGDQSITIAGETLAKCFDVSYAASHDESKQVLQGINLKNAKSGAKFAATDGHRLVVREYQTEEGIGVEAINIPARVSTFLRYVKPTDEVTIAYEEGMAVLKWGEYEITTRLLDGLYPDYEQLFPKTFDRSVRFDKKAALSAIDRVMVMDAGKIILNIEAGKITFSADTNESGAKETIEATLEGEAIGICLNPRYLSEALKHQEGETIVFKCNAPFTPIVLTSDGSTQESLMMPIKIRD